MMNYRNFFTDFLCAAVVVTISVILASGISNEKRPAKTASPSSPWEVEDVLEDGKIIRGYVLRNVDPRDIEGAGEMVVATSHNPATLQLLLDSLQSE